MIRIGIDPSFRKSGFAAAMIEDKTIKIKMFENYNDFVLWLFSEESPDKAKVVVENSNLQNSTFDTRGNKFEVARKSRNVGANQAVSQLTVWICELKFGKENVLGISPKKKGKKWTKDQFLLVIKAENLIFDSRLNNQDIRDAVKLCLFNY